MGRLKNQLVAREDETRVVARLGDLIPRGRMVACHCRRCGHSAELDAGTLAARIGPSVPVPEVGVHMRCSGCGSKDVASSVAAVAVTMEYGTEYAAAA